MTSISTLPPTSIPNAPAANEPAAAERGAWDRAWGKEGFSFGALLDIINPLHHIPVVSVIYRAISGDTIGPAARVAGGAIFGGVIGMIASAADAALEEITGKDAGSHLIAMLPEPDGETDIQMAGDHGRRGPLLAGLMSAPDATMTQLAAAETAQSAQAAAAKPAPDASASAPAASKTVSDPAAASTSVSQLINASTSGLSMKESSLPARPAQMGAGGRLVPLAASAGRTPVMSAPVMSAPGAMVPADRTAAPQAASAPHPASGRIDTAIKGRGLIAPSAARQPGPTWLDYATRDAGMTALDATTAVKAADKAKDLDRQDAGAKPTISPIPTVPPDLLMRMQQALDKYQSMRNVAPTVDVSH